MLYFFIYNKALLPEESVLSMRIGIKILGMTFGMLLVAVFSATGQPAAYFEHYGSEDGLPQHTITDILQDRNGFMWFSTWDGLSQFDGYTFTTYRFPNDRITGSQSSRIDQLYEDKFNNIWTLSYDNRVYRFDVQTRSFMRVNRSQEYLHRPFLAFKVVPVESGKVWVLSHQSGCISVLDSLFNTVEYSEEEGNLVSNQVYDVIEDTNKNTWILTQGGIRWLSSDGEEARSFKEGLPFFCVEEFTDELLWFGSKEGTVWIYDPKTEDFNEISTGLRADIISVQEVSSEKVFIASKYDGFVIYNKYDGSIEMYNPQTLPAMTSGEIISCYVDRGKNIWLETNSLGVSKFNPYTKRYLHFTPYVESSETNVFPPNFFIFEDKDARLWVHPRGGGFSLYDKESDRLEPFYNEPFSPHWRFSNMMHSAYSDKQGNLWMCTRSHGLEKVIFYDDSQFKSIIFDDRLHSTVNNDVRAIFEDSSNMIWVSTKDGIIHLYDDEMRELGILTDKGNVGEGVPLSGISYCIIEDSDKNIWIGTKGEGVYKLRRKNGHSFEIELHLKHDPGNIYSLSDNLVYSIFEDRYRNIWIGTFGGGINLIKKEDTENGLKVINHRNELSGYPLRQGRQVRVINSDEQGNICVGTTLGLIMFSLDFSTPRDIQYSVYVKKGYDSASIGANDVMDICTTSSGETYIATFGGGISKISELDDDGMPVAFETYDSSHGLPSNIILSVIEDHKGNLWIGSEGGLTKFSATEQTFETVSEIKRLLKQHNFSENSSFRLSDGRMLFGYSHGLVVFNPDKVRNNMFNPYLAFVQFRLFNRNIEVSPYGPLNKDINVVDNVVLRHDQNFVGIEFAALDYVDPKNILYAYKLDGFDKEWVYSGNQRTANYTNLSKGKYLFRVKSTNSDGVWVDNERVLSIEVLPPFWATGWAFSAYFVVAMLLLYFTYRILYTFYKMRHKIILEKQESEIKTKFFTNISHEIRTPLTMIVSPIDNLLHAKSTPEIVKEQLRMVAKNTNRLLDMVNQILDFQKMSQTPLTVKKIEIGPFVENLYASYRKHAELTNIRYLFENRVGSRLIWADTEALEKIVLNLLSNAFKYTPSGGEIKVSVFGKDDDVAVRVKDTGEGISKEKQARLFKRFESFNEDKSKPSTGIGLSIVKEMADKHGASIVVESEEQRGSSFTVYFKSGTDHLGKDVIFDQPDRKQEDRAEILLHGGDDDVQTEGRNGPSTVLVVEDDTDLRHFIRSILEEEYDVYEASNGKEGYEKALEVIPDFIVSDIMMPESDGIELLKNVRSNIRTSHALFLLLTAKTTLESKLEGFEFGADEYVSKPFSVSFFKTRIKNLLRRRDELQKYYREELFVLTGESLPSQSNEQLVSVGEKDKEFLRSVNSFIEKRMGNDDFVIEDLAMEVGMSRSVFFKKLKGLTGLAPVEYVRDVLMQHAAKFLLNGDYSVKEVSYMVGMTDAKYFTKCFKKKYNMTPSDFKRQNIK